MNFWIFPNVLRVIRRRDVVDRVPAFQLSGPGSIPSGVKILISILELGGVPLSMFCPVLSRGATTLLKEVGVKYIQKRRYNKNASKNK